MKHPAPSAVADIPGSAHGVEITGLPQAGDSYLANGVALGRLILGDRIEGTAYGLDNEPRMTGLTLAYLNELIYAATLERDRVAAWGTGAVA